MSEYIIRPPEKVGSSLDLQPIIVGEIVRCRDCEHLNIVGKCPCGFFAMENLDGYCAWGIKLKEGGDD